MPTPTLELLLYARPDGEHCTRWRMPNSLCIGSTCISHRIHRPSLHAGCNVQPRRLHSRQQAPIGWYQQLPRAIRGFQLRPAAAMQGAGALAGVSALMFVGSYLAGLLPMLRAGNTQTLQLVSTVALSMHAQQHLIPLPVVWPVHKCSTKQRCINWCSQINAAGAGLLVGAAMCVVLPEGFMTFAEAQVRPAAGA